MKKTLIWLLIVTTTMATTMPSQGWAMLAPAATGDEAAPEKQQDLQTIQAALESKLLQQRLAEFNLTPQQVNERLSRLSREEIHQAALQMEAINPAGDGLSYILLVSALVLLIIYLWQRV